MNANSFATKLRNAYKAGTGAIAIEGRDETHILRDIVTLLPAGTPIATVAAASGPVLNFCTGGPIDPSRPIKGTAEGYAWASAGPGRVLVVFDWHTLANAAGTWRALKDALPGLRNPANAPEGAAASLVVFIGPTFELSLQNPLRGELPILSYPPPDRAAIERSVTLLGIDAATPLTEEVKESVIDALCGLSCTTLEQVTSEVLAAGNGWDVASLRLARRQELASAGLELWEPISELGGLSLLQDFCTSEVFPWLRDPQLSVRRLLCAGLPGTGKSYSARWLAQKLGCECVRLSIPALKAGIVGASEGNLRRAFRVIDSMAAYAPLVVVLDEIDTIARDGLDGGTSSGMFAELLTWLQESTSQALVLATLNRLYKLDAALESRFQGKFFVDLPTLSEREAVAAIHLKRVGCKDIAKSAKAIAEHTDGFSSREIGENLIPSLARRTNRKPDKDTIATVAGEIVPSSVSHADDLATMKKAAQTLRRANNPEEATEVVARSRRIRPSVPFTPTIDSKNN